MTSKLTPGSDILLALAAVALWSTVASAFKLGLSLYTPLQLVTLSVAIAAVFFLTLSLATGRLEHRALEALSCLLYTSPSPRDQRGSRMPSSA